MKLSVDVAVVGSGFGGSLAALVARRLGLSVALLERGTHPRFAIGESTSPLANLLLEELARRYELPRLLPLCKWGTWRRQRAEVACGLKRGFSFYAHRADHPFAADPNRGDQLLVAASPRDEIADTHWYRPDFDFFLVGEARESGAEYLDGAALDRIETGDGGVRISGERAGEPLEVRARLAVDASGPRGFLWKTLGVGEQPFEGLPETSGLYTHFMDVRRLDEMNVLPSGETPPYPPDDAALHHIFEGGWIWVLRFGNGLTSAGVAAQASLARALRFEEGAPAWDRLLDRLPAVRDQFAGARPALPFVHRLRLPFRAARASGPGWTMLPSAAAFVDPLLSTGFPLTLLGIERLGRALEEDWGSPRLAPRLEREAERSLFETDAAALLVGALYATFDDFPLFAALSKLYFAAASFSEAARRLGRPEFAGSFLCADREPFGARMRGICRRAIASRGTDRRSLIDEVHRAIAPLDVAGLGRRDRRNWYPFRGEDLVENAGKVGASAGEARELLARCGLAEAAADPIGAATSP
ncbi:MAG TPA: FAD-dependent oxidoreductase [Thermoanaerobaculia bacterium]|nr:FAD-dependent oxidoreductase [Thermoanaerobaculia bacterium]